MQQFLEVAKNLAMPDMFHPPSSTFALQTPNQPWSQPPAANPNLIPTASPVATHQPPAQPPQLTNPSSEASTFFCKPTRPDGCAFCTQSGHLVHSCPGAIEYVNTGRAMVKNGRIHLPNGQPIPNDGSGRGLKHGIDTWLAANLAPTPEASSAPVQLSNPIPFQCNAPPHHPHATLSFEAIRSEVHMAQITDTADTADNSTDEDDSDLYNLFEVLAAERSDRKKRDTRSSKPQDTPPSQPAMSSAPATPAQSSTSTTRPTPQYRYQSNAEDLKLTSQLFNWLLEGKLGQATLVHILAASAPIHKDLVERLCTRHVDTGTFEQLTTPDPAPLPEPEYSLPLQEIDVIVGGHNTEAGVIDPGSQIVAIRKDLADEVAACINPGVRLEMEGANGATNWTLGCAEHLTMQVGDVSFTLHAHVVKHAPFHLLLGQPF